MQKILEIPHWEQFLDVADPIWQERSCAIISLAMVLNYYGKEIDVERAIQKGLKMKVYDPELGIVGGHDPKFGWRHDAIIGLAKYHGFEANRMENDCLENLLAALNREEPVIISIHKKFDQKNDGHLVVLTGYYQAGGKIVTLFVNDPIGNPYKHKNIYIPLEKFMGGWKKKAIYVRKVTSNN